MSIAIRRTWNRVYGDFLMPSGLGSFRRFLESIMQAGYDTVSVEAFWRLAESGAIDPARRYLILRHDIDTDPRTGAEMWRIEQSLGLAGSYYFRLSTLDVDLMHSIARGGGDVGYHYEELATLAKERHLRDRAGVLRAIPDAQDRFRRNLEMLRTLTGLPMRVVSSHGDFVNRHVGVPNWAILIDRRARDDAGIDLEVYDEAFLRHVSSRHTDTEHPRHWAHGDLVASLERAPPGRVRAGPPAELAGPARRERAGRPRTPLGGGTVPAAVARRSRATSAAQATARSPPEARTSRRHSALGPFHAGPRPRRTCSARGFARAVDARRSGAARGLRTGDP